MVMIRQRAINYRYRNILVARGVPEAFLDDIARRWIPSVKALTLMLMAWFGLSYVPLFLSFNDGVRATNVRLYGSVAAGADMFFPNAAVVLFCTAGYFLLLFLPVWAAPVYLGWFNSSKAKVLTGIALKLCTVQPGEKAIRHDPHLAELADLPTADAFLARLADEQAPRLAREAEGYRGFSLWFGSIVAVLLLGSLVWAQNNYTRIVGQVIEHDVMGRLDVVPFAQVDGIRVECRYVSTRYSHRYAPEYDLHYGGGIVRLFSDDNPLKPAYGDDALAKVAVMDGYLKKTFGAFGKARPEVAARCVADWKDRDPAELALLEQVLTR